MDIQPILDFLGCPTPPAWLGAAAEPDNLPVLLRDHAACELKAAQSAQSLIWKYAPGDGAGDSSSGVLGAAPDFFHTLSRLAREELRHFEQVLTLMRQRGIDYAHVSPSRYAGALRRQVRAGEAHKLVDILIVGAFIEARSCERFAALGPLLDAPLAAFYRSLLKSEARHYQHYLRLASRFAEGPIDARVTFFRQCEVALINEPDAEFRFHSGAPEKRGEQFTCAVG